MTVTFIELGDKGQLGNQLFQISSVIGSALYHNDDWILPKWLYFNYFNIPANYFSNEIHINRIHNELCFHYAGIPSFKGEVVSLSGYYQASKYWQDYANVVLKLLMPKRLGSYKDYTAIHVRRTDYLIHTECYSILDMHNYYEKAMMACPSKNYLIFSDDLDWCKKHFVGNEFSFSEERHPAIDLGNMIGCKNNIIANSSFSWWAAWLNKTPDKKIVAPVTWFGPKLSLTHDTKDLLPKEWIKV
ncbi:hypothetical protein LCGC14_0413720 [marine sediment metagenome]|uniref:Glycosyl transferase family 11 n=1 Tax=marine sediment metagenome TaxID=412755 RepID=A0A0F9ST39_9ZZZZ